MLILILKCIDYYILHKDALILILFAEKTTAAMSDLDEKILQIQNKLKLKARLKEQIKATSKELQLAYAKERKQKKR